MAQSGNSDQISQLCYFVISYMLEIKFVTRYNALESSNGTAYDRMNRFGISGY